MKKTLTLFFVFIFLGIFLNMATAEEVVVQMSVPGCSA